MEQHDYGRLQILKAERKVKELKGFYFHLFLYLTVNLAWLLILFSLDEMSSYSQYGFWGMGYGHISMAVVWGIALLIHGVLVFGKNMSFSKKWEDRKIKELLNKEKQYWE